jgi:glycosyltransferase involved in cell wall biosynthesis
MNLSVAVITQNEADRLPRCLESGSFARDIVVVDSGSTDRTVEVARNYGARVFEEAWRGFSGQKQRAVELCRTDWVLILDADECLPEETARALRKGTEASLLGGAAAGRFHRKNFFHGRWIRHCGWWPDPVVRLVDRRRGRFSDHRVHERWVPRGPVRDLNLTIEHRSFRNYSGLIDKMERYSTLAAREMVESGRRASGWSAVSHGSWMFFRTFALESGWREGFDGFMISVLNAMGSFLKYAKCREALRAKRGESNSDHGKAA